jgi:hypothetical protein
LNARPIWLNDPDPWQVFCTPIRAKFSQFEKKKSTNLGVGSADIQGGNKTKRIHGF